MSQSDDATFDPTFDEAIQAAQSLARCFDGVVILDDDQDDRQDIPSIESDPLFEATDLDPDLDVDPEQDVERESDDSADRPSAVPMLISLNQLRQWYVIARQMGHGDRLDRIIQLGTVFKQQFGDADPDTPQPFTGWSTAEVEIWLADLVNFQRRKSSPKPHPNSTNHS